MPGESCATSGSTSDCAAGSSGWYAVRLASVDASGSSATGATAESFGMQPLFRLCDLRRAERGCCRIEVGHAALPCRSKRFGLGRRSDGPMIARSSSVSAADGNETHLTCANSFETA
jgi:hypothetical protein